MGYEYYTEEDRREDMSYLCDRLRQARESMGESQLSLANKMDVSHITVCRNENGKHIPGLDYIFRLLNVTNLSALYFMPPRFLKTDIDQIITNYSKLNPANQSVVCNTMETLISNLLATQTKN